MAVLNEIPLEMAFPGHTRRRIWKSPEVRSHSIVVLTFNALHLAPPTGEPRPEAVQALEDGADLDAVLGPLATSIDLGSIRRAKLDLLANSLTLQHETPGHALGRLVIVFENQAAADACFTKLWRRLGTDFQLLPYKRDPWTLARVPVIVMLATVVVTLILAVMASELEDVVEARAAGMFVPQPPSFAERTLGRVSWQTICAIGGGCAALMQVWFYRRVTEPPIRLEIARTT